MACNCMKTEADTIKMCKIRDVRLPEKSHTNDAGFDFFIPNDFETKQLRYGESILIPTGIKVIVPHGYALIVMNKSGVALRCNLQIGACVIDEGYTGEVLVHMYNHHNPDNVVEFFPGMKFVQLVLVRIGNHAVEEIDTETYNAITSQAERGENGFGSTGV